MERLVRRENIKHCRDLLRTVKTQAEREQIEALFCEELNKQRDEADDQE